MASAASAADPAAASGTAVVLAQAIGSHAMWFYVAALVLAIVSSAWTWERLQRRERRLRLAGAAPATFVAVHLRFVLVAILVAAAVFLAMTDGLGAGRAMGVFDPALAATLSRSLAPATMTVFATVTHLADERTLIGLAVAVALVLLMRREVRLAIGWALGCAGNGLLNPALKHLFERVRPTHDVAYVTSSVYSFPSGHTSGAVVVYGLLAYVLVRTTPPRWHAAIVVTTVALVVTIGCSRILLQVHWASDVIGGLASGAAWLAVCITAIEAFRHGGRRDDRPAAV